MAIDYPFPVTLEAGRAIFRQNPLAAWLAFQPEFLAPGRVEATMTVEEKHLAPNGFLHAAVITALADIACGLGTVASLPSKEFIFATLELKTNLLGTARQGVLRCVATARHLGKTTQVWDVEITADATGKTLALFRCTQMVLENR